MADDQAPTDKPAAPVTGKVKSAGIGLRDGPDATRTPFADMAQGTPVKILMTNQDDSWAMVTGLAGGQERVGWLQTQFIILDGMTDPPPGHPTDPPPSHPADPAPSHPVDPTPSSPAGPGRTNPRFPGFFFTALVPGGFFSSEPDNLNILRAIRTNNPGAINDSIWQHSRPGYVGTTIKDSAGNITAIYSSPEYGVASWYTLLADHYGFKDNADGAFTVTQLAHHYAGNEAMTQAVKDYISSWCSLADSPLTPQSTIHLGNDNEMVNLARGVFKNESRAIVPISNAQILFGIQKQRTNTLPTPPKPP